MKLLEALEIIRNPAPESSPPFRVFLACGFTPLYLKTCVQAYLRQALSGRAVTVDTGLFGDLAGELERISSSEAISNLHACIVVIEWADLDERLGFRSAGGWREQSLQDIEQTVSRSLERLSNAIEHIAARVPVVVSTPSLPVAPVSYSRPDRGDAMFWAFEAAVAKCALRLGAHEQISVLNPRWLDSVSPPGSRADYKLNVTAGDPYQLQHTDALAETLVSFVAPAPPAKGLITDLDDTLWSGILGEVGVEGVQWTLEYKAQVHGLYQQFLQSLADAGVLTGIASKNDAELVRQVFEDRKDLLLEPDALFPREVNWGPKSESVRKVLEAWNVGPDAVVFVDDSPMEVAEVVAVHPEIRGFVFPKDDPAGAVDLLFKLRRMFGKSTITPEDKIRARSLRTSAAPITGDGAQPASASEDFLRSAGAVIRFDCANPPRDGRALELVNKTNQFNLNGIRYTEAEWTALLRKPDAFVCVVSYEDRFGPLGRISVLAGTVEQDVLRLAVWVMSCRAFSRRIEHACLRYLFDHFDVTRIEFPFSSTPRNGPTQDFLKSMTGTAPAASECVLDRATFDTHAPDLYQQIIVEKAPDALQRVTTNE